MTGIARPFDIVTRLSIEAVDAVPTLRKPIVRDFVAEAIATTTDAVDTASIDQSKWFLLAVVVVGVGQVARI